MKFKKMGLTKANNPKKEEEKKEEIKFSQAARQAPYILNQPIPQDAQDFLVFMGRKTSDIFHLTISKMRMLKAHVESPYIKNNLPEQGLAIGLSSHKSIIVTGGGLDGNASNRWFHEIVIKNNKLVYEARQSMIYDRTSHSMAAFGDYVMVTGGKRSPNTAEYWNRQSNSW